MLRKAITTLAAVATLILVVKILAVPGPTAADTEAAKVSVQNAMSIYDLHINYPTMKAIAAQKVPQP
jgi:hypothetical protein